MKYSELPKAYKQLADKYKPITCSVMLGNRFDWGLTDEGYEFWRTCANASDESELPPLPKDQRIEQLEKRIEELEKAQTIASGVEWGSLKSNNNFEVGDYVVILDKGHFKHGSVGQIKNITDTGLCPIKVNLGDWHESFGAEDLRHATEEEIEQATKNTVGGYEVSEGEEYTERDVAGIPEGGESRNKIKIGCEEFKHSFIYRLKRLLNDQDVQIILEGQDVTQDILKL